jgi:hypothetical protein
VANFFDQLKEEGFVVKLFDRGVRRIYVLDRKLIEVEKDRDHRKFRQRNHAFY